MKTLKQFLVFLIVLSSVSLLNAQTVIGSMGPTNLEFWTDGTPKAYEDVNGNLSNGMTNTTSGEVCMTNGVNNNIGAGCLNNLTSGVENNVTDASSHNLVAGIRNQVTNSRGIVVAGYNNIVTNGSRDVVLGWANESNDHNQVLIGQACIANQEYSGCIGTALSATAWNSYYFGGTNTRHATNALPNTVAIGIMGGHTALFDDVGVAIGTGDQVGPPNITTPNDNATARLDVYADQVVTNQGNFYPTGVRFRDLPYGHGEVLVIDPDGYVHKSPFVLFDGEDDVPTESYKQLQDQIDALQRQVTALQSLLTNGQSSAQEKVNRKPIKVAKESLTQPTAEMELFPNPTDGRLTVNHQHFSADKETEFVVTDMKGVQVFSSVIQQSSTQFNLPDHLANGTYVCSIYENGKLVSTKQFIYTQK